MDGLSAGAGWIELAGALAVLAAVGPLAIAGARFARRQRGAASAAASLLLIFGLAANVSPPPPPRVEVEVKEDEEAGDDEPK